MKYPYRCFCCDHRFSVDKPADQHARSEPCPDCGTEIIEQDFMAKRIGGFVNTTDAWSEGRTVVQLGPKHPDRMVTSKGQMEKVYRKHGICLETGHYVSKEAQVKATLPRSKRTGQASNVCSGLRDDAS